MVTPGRTRSFRSLDRRRRGAGKVFRTASVARGEVGSVGESTRRTSVRFATRGPGSVGRSTVLVFMHLPKAAGLTVRQVIERQYGAERVFVPQPQDESELARGDWRYVSGEAPLPFKNVPGYDPNVVPRRWLSALGPEAISRLDVVMGHLWFGIHDALPRPAAYLTILRDPVERVLSLYYYRKRRQGLTGTLEDYLAAGRDFETNNGQTRYLCGRLEGVDVRFTACTPVMLELAKSRLQERFSVVGVAERFDESLLLMARTFGWAFPFYESHNVNRLRPRGGEVSKHLRERIADENRFDQELHAFARKLLDEQLAAQSPPIGAEAVRGFRRSMMVHRSRALRAMYPAARPAVRLVRSLGRVTRRWLPF
jgi:hypothetical protein